MSRKGCFRHGQAVAMLTALLAVLSALTSLHFAIHALIIPLA